MNKVPYGTRGLLCVVGMAALVVIGNTPASASGTNLLTNGDFELGTTSGWSAYQSTISVASDGVGGGSAGKASNGTATNYGLRTSAKPVTGGVAGTQYTGTGMVRSDTPGKQVCIYLTEYDSSNHQVGQTKTCTVSTSQWTPLATVSRTLVGSGGSMAFAVRQSSAVAGESFEVDNLSLVQETSAGPQNVALWHMNDTTGAMLDSGLPPANNGTLSGTIARTGSAYTFTRGWVTVPDDASLDPGTAKVTITANVNPTSLPKTGDFDVLRKGDSPSQLYKVEILQSGALFCQFHGSGHTVGATSTTLIAPNTGFHAISCVKTTSQVQAIVDGNITSKSGNVGAISNSAPVVIGAHTGGNNDFFKGGMDEVSLTFG
jgi:hypothetical protein